MQSHVKLFVIQAAVQLIVSNTDAQRNDGSTELVSS